LRAYSAEGSTRLPRRLVPGHRCARMAPSSRLAISRRWGLQETAGRVLVHVFNSDCSTFRAAGFSPSGHTLAIATSSDLTLWTKGVGMRHGEPEGGELQEATGTPSGGSRLGGRIRPGASPAPAARPPRDPPMRRHTGRRPRSLARPVQSTLTTTRCRCAAFRPGQACQGTGCRRVAGRLAALGRSVG
jgi:hypothetical protein